MFYNSSDTADRAAHDWAVEAMTQESSLGVEVIGTNFAGPGQNLVQVQVCATAFITWFSAGLLYVLADACDCTALEGRGPDLQICSTGMYVYHGL